MNPKKPTNLKILEGNPGKRTLAFNEIKPSPAVPVCPEWVHEYAREEWERMAGKLERLGLMTETDVAAFTGYCQTYARWREAEEHITIEGSVKVLESGYPQQNPYVSIAHKNLSLMGVYIGKFGMSPSDRVGLVSGKAEENNSKMGRLLSK